MAEEERLQNQLTSGLKRKAEIEAEVTSGSPAAKKLGLMAGTKYFFYFLNFSYHHCGHLTKFLAKYGAHF